MITSLLLAIVYGFVWIVSSPLRLLPDVSLPADVLSSINTAAGYIQAVSYALPATTILAIFASVLGVEALILSYKGIMWLIRRIPTQS